MRTVSGEKELITLFPDDDLGDNCIQICHLGR